jgi:hypothetical protein
MERIITLHARIRIIRAAAPDDQPFSERPHRIYLPKVGDATREEEKMKTKKAKLSKGKKLEAQKPLRDVSSIPVTKPIDVGSAK